MEDRLRGGYVRRVALPFPIGSLHDPQEFFGVLSLLMVLVIAAVLNSKRVASHATVPLASLAVLIALGTTYRLVNSPRSPGQQGAPVFYPDSTPSPTTVRFRLT